MNQRSKAGTPETLKRAAAYYRSSKDAADIAVEIQRPELATFAQAQGYIIVAEYSDLTISGSLDEVSRPGLRELLACVRGRKVDAVLAIDPSRIARDPMLSAYVHRECEKHDVAVCYAKLPVGG